MSDTQQPANVPGPEPKAHILIADDDAFLSSLFGEVLARGGYAVTYARNGKAAVAGAETLKYALVLMDVMMPEMDGFEALERIKANPATSHLPVIMLTSMSQPEDVERGLKAGAAAYLEKTKVIPTDTLGKIEEVLRNAQEASAKEPKPAAKKATTKKSPGKKGGK